MSLAIWPPISPEDLLLKAASTQSLHLQLRTMPALSLAFSHTEAIHIRALDALHTHLTQAIDLLGITVSKPQDPRALASTLAILADALNDSTALLKGVPLNEADPGWKFNSCPPHHFTPQPGSNLSIYIGLQESAIVLWLRALEPADAPVHFGTKLALAIGTVRRLEHDEMDTVFSYSPKGGQCDATRGSARHTPEPRPVTANESEIQNVYVREKVRVESADPSLISLHSKLNFLNNMLGQARRNLVTVMGVDMDE